MLSRRLLGCLTAVCCVAVAGVIALILIWKSQCWMFTESLFERNRDDLQLQADVFDGQNRFVMVSRVTLSGSVYYSIRPTWDDSSEHGDFRVPKHYAEREEVFWATHLPSLISDVWLSEKGVTLETFLASTGIGEPQFHHWRQVLRRYQAYGFMRPCYEDQVKIYVTQVAGFIYNPREEVRGRPEGYATLVRLEDRWYYFEEHR